MCMCRFLNCMYTNAKVQWRAQQFSMGGDQLCIVLLIVINTSLHNVID